MGSLAADVIDVFDYAMVTMTWLHFPKRKFGRELGARGIPSGLCVTLGIQYEAVNTTGSLVRLSKDVHWHHRIEQELPMVVTAQL